MIAPNLHPFLRLHLVWLTDLDVPDRFALGLTSTVIACDRTTYRCRVEPQPGVEHWPTFARRHRIPAYVRDVLESESLPTHWYVSDAPLPVGGIERPPQQRSIFDAVVPL